MVFTVAFQTVRAGMFDFLKPKPSDQTSTSGTSSLAGLSQDQMIGGLKEALGKGVQQAIANLGRQDGFLTNLSVKIPMPKSLQSVERTLRALRQENSPMISSRR